MYQVAIVGAGAVGGLHANAIAAVNNTTLRAICDPVPENAAALSSRCGGTTYTHLEEMLDSESIDIAILSLPTFLHAEYVERCSARGISVLCEKPIEMSRRDAQKVADSARRHGVKLMVAQVVRFWPGYADIKHMYDDGQLGDVLMAVFSRSSMVPARGGWIIDPEKGRGAIQDMHVHDIDFISYMFGNAETVFSHAARDYTGCFNHVVSSVKFENGVRAVAEASFTMLNNSYPFSTFFRVCGTKATVEYNYRASANDTLQNAKAEMSIYRQDTPVHTVALGDYDPYARQLEYFVECVDKDVPFYTVPLESSLRSISLLDTVRASAASERAEVVHEA